MNHHPNCTVKETSYVSRDKCFVCNAIDRTLDEISMYKQ